MKSISAALVVLSATALLIAGAFVAHNDTALFLQASGCGLGIIGLAGWLTTLRAT